MFKKKLNVRPEVLPEGWEAKEMNGKTVFVNHVTKKTQWERPKMSNAACHDALNDTSVEPSAAPSAARHVAKVDGPVRESSSSRKREELPHGWRKAKTKDGETLYVNDIEKITSWDRPVAIAPPATAPQHGSEGRLENGRRPSSASTASNSPADDGVRTSSSRDKGDESRRARRRPSNDSTGMGVDNSQGRHERKASSSGRHHRSSRSSSARDERDEEPGSPLPHGWSTGYTKSGRQYYRDEYDQCTSWEKPTADASTGRAVARNTRSGSSSGSGRDNHDPPAKATPSVPKESSESPLPAGWSMVFTKSGKPYYRNDNDESTSWDRPTEASGRRAVAGSNSNRSSGKEKSRPVKSSSRERQEQPEEASNRRDVTSSSRGSSGSSSRDSGGRLTKASLTAANLAPGSPLPAGWSKGVTKDGETYYRNDHDETTTWDKPKGAANPRAVASSKEKSRTSKSSGGEQQENPLPPGWSQDVTADGKTYYRNHSDQTTSWDRPMLARPRAPRRHSTSGVRDGPPPPLPARNARGSSAGDLHAQQQPAMAAPAPAVFDPTMFGMPPGTQVPPQLQQQMMMQQQMMQQQMMMQGQQQLGQPTGTPMGMFAAPPTTALGKGLNFLAKRMAEPPTVKPPPKGYVGLNGGGFTNAGGFNASTLRAPRKMQKPKKEEPSSFGDKAGNFFVKGLNKGINTGLGAVGAGDLYKVDLKKKKKGGLKWGGKPKLPGLGSGSDSESGGDDGGEIDVDLNIDINADVEVEVEEEEG